MNTYGRYINKASFIERRRALRGKNSTRAEQILWKKLKAKQFGVKFRRQHNIGNYIVDFYCHEYKFIIELDGWVHGEYEQGKKDIQRQQWLESHGYIVKRYKNEQIKHDFKSILQDIWDTITVFKRAKDPS